MGGRFRRVAGPEEKAVGLEGACSSVSVRFAHRPTRAHASSSRSDPPTLMTDSLVTHLSDANHPPTPPNSIHSARIAFLPSCHMEQGCQRQRNRRWKAGGAGGRAPFLPTLTGWMARSNQSGHQENVPYSWLSNLEGSF